VPDESIRRLTLADFADDRVQDRLDALIGAGETLFVERKVGEPKDGLGATVASFANTLGGWILLGVSNDGEVIGFEPPGRVDLQDWVRDVVRPQVDPLPPLAAASVHRDGKQVGIVRIAESLDTPHLVKTTGAVYVREPGGKRPITNHRELLEMARRGQDAERHARERLVNLPMLRDAMARDWGRLSGDNPAELPSDPLVDLVVLASPLTVPPHFADRCLSRGFVADGGLPLTALFPPTTPDRSTFGRPEPFARGVAFIAEQTGARARAVLAVDAGGVVGVRLTYRRPARGAVPLEALGHEYLAPLARIAAETLRRLDALGRSSVRFELDYGEALTIDAGQGQIAELRQLPVPPFAGGELPIPADAEDIDTLVGRWLREIARLAGLPQWES
jgi:hypothetical protein